METELSDDEKENLPALPDDIDLEHARLPMTYENAKSALEKLDKIDEVHGWANKMDALASYARQMRDTTLEDYARRIKARAVRRMGQLLKALPVLRAGRKKKFGDRGPRISKRAKAAKDAGISPDQQKDAITLANIDEQKFEQDVEASPAPGIKTLVGKDKSITGEATRVDEPEPDNVVHLHISQPEPKVEHVKLTPEMADPAYVDVALGALETLFRVAVHFKGKVEPVVAGIKSSKFHRFDELKDGIDYVATMRKALDKKRNR
jgi:hypothetical protein